MSETPAIYHTPHGTEEREVFLPEPAIGDPGDETTEKPFVGVNRCWNCGQMYVTDHDHLCRFADTRQGKSFAAGMAPTYEEFAAAVQAFDDGLFPLNMPLPPSLELAWNDVWGQMTMLAARLPRGR